MTVDLKKLAEVAANECIRQQVGVYELSALLVAYDHVANRWSKQIDITDPSYVYQLEQRLLYIATTIEDRNHLGYRKVPVTFNGGSETALDHQNIPTAMTQHLSFIPQVLEQPYDNPSVDWWVFNFLKIHPFLDGNGRTAWILYNWLSGTMNDPAPLPDYFSVLKI